MDRRIVWSPEAIEDVEAISEYISRDSVFYARSVAARIIQVARSIESFPMMGRVVRELKDETVRERLVYSYRIVYQIQPERIIIVAVIHGARLLENVLYRFGAE